ncbi:expressed unknown protein [Seminavis robusta]|uniref:Uncharacterized protein n=1 Tax=Seminavis robusta TaxID=568900 RepID=A0A9N8HN99_9STRA|nr:expressed unknown protein [Seminavis robusta]|eukprot:Sro804_g204880.1 n/a (468) ;mRNA; f:15228-16717
MIPAVGFVVFLLSILAPLSLAIGSVNQHDDLNLSHVERSLVGEATIEGYVLGNNGQPESVYPLPLCAGDCDDDEDCGDGLICYDRGPLDAIPGCLGGEEDSSRTDYCILDPSQESQSPTTSMSPSVSPSTAPSRYSAPSSSPSKSSEPSQPPTKIPSAQPTISLAPTKSLQPSSRPSSRPSEQPSLRPTSPPTGAPTNYRGPFQLKLFWHQRSCWQEDCNNESHWCMQCEGYRCNVGDILWVEPCRFDKPPMQLFEWLPVPANVYPNPSLRATEVFGQLQSAEWDQDIKGYLCLEKVGDRRYTLQECSVQSYKQWFTGFDPNNAFELYNPPNNLPTTTVKKDHCLTMPHHPRQFEGIYHTDCEETRGDRTNRWIAVYEQNTPQIFRSELDTDFRPNRYYRIGERRSNPSCKDVTPCGLCQGHCYTDDDCEGSLKCFQRNRWNKWETPPGCFGDGVPGMDYCYAKPGT